MAKKNEIISREICLYRKINAGLFQDNIKPNKMILEIIMLLEITNAFQIFYSNGLHACLVHKTYDSISEIREEHD